jgi:hypothetical protein
MRRASPRRLPARRLPAWTALLALGLLAGCASTGDVGGMLLVTHDKYTAFTCDEIAKQRANFAVRERELSALSQKAEAAPGGMIVNAVAYSTDLAHVRAELRAADYAAQEKTCGPPVAAPAAAPIPPPPPPRRKR